MSGEFIWGKQCILHRHFWRRAFWYVEKILLTRIMSLCFSNSGMRFRDGSGVGLWGRARRMEELGRIRTQRKEKGDEVKIIAKNETFWINYEFQLFIITFQRVWWFSAEWYMGFISKRNSWAQAQTSWIKALEWRPRICVLNKLSGWLLWLLTVENLPPLPLESWLYLFTFPPLLSDIGSSLEGSFIYQLWRKSIIPKHAANLL